MQNPPVVMGILNVTPDSFYDGGLYAAPAAALERAGEIYHQGGKIIDIGGASTRPGAADVSEEEEMRRVIPVVEAVRQKYPRAQISIDTFNFQTAQAALQAGASIINDVSALADIRLADLAREHGAKLVITHTRGTPQTMDAMTDYADILAEIYTFFEAKIAAATARGLARGQIILDIGPGFAKTNEQNWFLLENLKYFDRLNLPLLVAASRKRFTGGTLELSLKAAAMGAAAGAAIIRAHDVAETFKHLEEL